MMGRPPPGPVGRSAGGFNYSLWQADMFGFLSNLAKEYGDIVGFDLGNSPCILVNGAKQVRELFSVHEVDLCKPEFVKDSNRGHWGDGLTTLEGDSWRQRRATLRPTFTAHSIAQRMPVVASCTIEMLDKWKSGAVLDLGREMRVLTARIAVRTLLDADVEGFGSSDNRSGLLLFEQAFGEDYHGLAEGDSTTPLSLVRPRAPRCMDSVIGIIDHRIATQEMRSDVLSDLVIARHPDGTKYSRENIIGEIMQMLYAGHLTIPFSLLNFWRDVASHYSESLIATEARSHGVIGLSTTTSLSQTYCIAALKESLRLHPPAPIIYRDVETAFELDGYTFPRGSAVWVCPQLLHRDPRFYQDPAQFLPERFMANDSDLKNGSQERIATARAVYLPFGAGPRTCIAHYQALQQMALIGLLVSTQFKMIPRQSAGDNFQLRKLETLP